MRTQSVGVPVSAEPPTASGNDGDDEGYEDDATAAAAVDMDDVGGGGRTCGAGSSSRSGHRGAGRDSEQKGSRTDGAAGTVSRSVTATAAAAAAEALNVGGSNSRTARGSKSIFDTFGVTLPKGFGPRDWASSPSSEI